MNELQLELTKLIGRKDLTFGCLVKDEQNNIGTFVFFAKDHLPGIYNKLDVQTAFCVEHGSPFIIEEILNHPATLSDFHRWLSKNFAYWIFDCNGTFRIEKTHASDGSMFLRWYDSSKDLLDQDEENLKQIVEFIKANQ